MSLAKRDVRIGPFTAHQIKELGRGKFGPVFIATKRGRDEKYAARQIAYQLLETGEQRIIKVLKEDLEKLRGLKRHKNVVKYNFCYDDIGKDLWLVNEYCDLFDMEQYFLRDQKHPSLDTKTDLMYQCASGVAHLHSQSPPIVHGDIKMKNFLIKMENNRAVVKLTDYGFINLLQLDLAQTHDSLLLSVAFQTPFAAPEKHDENKQLLKCPEADIFSLGLVIQVILNYGEESTLFLPQTADGETDLLRMSIGMYICYCAKNGNPIPQLVRKNKHDASIVNTMKELIIDMTPYEQQKRKKIQAVVADLEKLLPKNYQKDQTYEDSTDDEEHLIEEKEEVKPSSSSATDDTDLSLKLSELQINEPPKELVYQRTVPNPDVKEPDAQEPPKDDGALQTASVPKDSTNPDVKQPDAQESRSDKFSSKPSSSTVPVTIPETEQQDQDSNESKNPSKDILRTGMSADTKANFAKFQEMFNNNTQEHAAQNKNYVRPKPPKPQERDDVKQKEKRNPMVRASTDPSENSEDDDEDTNIEQFPVKPPSCSEMMDFITKARHFMSSHSNTEEGFDALNCIEDIVTKVAMCNKKQTRRVFKKDSGT